MKLGLSGYVNQSGSWNAFARIVRFHEYGPCYLISALACGFIAKFPVDVNLIPVLLFVATSSIFGFVINDIADAELDRNAGKLRNPIASGDLSASSAWMITTIFLVASIFLLYPLNLLSKLFGVVVLILFSGYSFGPRVKTRPGIDIFWHASWNALYGLMAYTLYRPIEFLAVALSGMLFLSSMLVELLNEIRDHDSEKSMIKTTVTLIGKKRALKICILILLLILSIFVSIVLIGELPLALLIFSPSIVFLVMPIIKVLGSERDEQKLLPTLASRGTVIGILIFVAYLVIRATGIG